MIETERASAGRRSTGLLAPYVDRRQLVEPIEKVGEQVVVHDGKMPRETLAKPSQILVGQKADRYDAVRHCPSPMGRPTRADGVGAGDSACDMIYLESPAFEQNPSERKPHDRHRPQ